MGAPVIHGLKLANGAKIENFKLDFEAQQAQYIRVSIQPLSKTPKGGGAWLFVDEILVN